MAEVPKARARRNVREQRVFLCALAVCTMAALVAFAAMYVPAGNAYWNYSPQEGDILFQSLPHSPLVDAIEGASGSPYSHCGIVADDDGRWVVLEAYRNVEVTPLREFIFRGRGQGFAVYRLRTDQRHHIPATIANAKSYLGRPYDSRYRMDDERIYCSELIYKAYRDATGQPLGPLVTLGELSWQPYEQTITDFERGPAPLDREMITPKHMAQAEQLELVTAFNIEAY